MLCMRGPSYQLFTCNRVRFVCAAICLFSSSVGYGCWKNKEFITFDFTLTPYNEDKKLKKFKKNLKIIKPRNTEISYSPDSTYITNAILLFCVSVATTYLEKANRLPCKFNAHTTPPSCFSTSPWDAERAMSAWCWWRVWAGPPSYSWTSCLRCPTRTTGPRLPCQQTIEGKEKDKEEKRGVDGTA